MTTTMLMKDNVLLGLAFRFRGLVHYCCGRKHNDMQADMVLQRQLIVLYFGRQQEKRKTGP